VTDREAPGNGGRSDPAAERKAADPAPGRWLAQGAAVTSGRLAAEVAKDPTMRELRRLAPDLVVLEMTAERAEQLQAELSDELIVENDAALDPPGG
jgi:hypothetical protein